MDQHVSSSGDTRASVRRSLGFEQFKKKKLSCHTDESSQLPVPAIMSDPSLQTRTHTTDIPQPAAMNRSNPAFLNKLRSMVDDPNTDELIRWSAAGDTFLVPNHVRFGEEVLPRFFKHNNFSSFVRQLNMYGFHKVPHIQQGALKSDQPSQSELWEFSNRCFHRDHPDLLSKVQRKRSGKEREHQHTNSIDESNRVLHNMSGALTRGDFDSVGDPQDVSSVVGPVQMTNLLSAIQGIKSNQRTLIEELSKLQHSSQALWQQGLENRQQIRRQQDTINRILRFLASVFGSSNVGDMLQNTSGSEFSPFNMPSDDTASAHHFQGRDGTYASNLHRGPVRPQKRARLLISDAPYADPMAEDHPTPDQDTNVASPLNSEQRFTEATSDTEGSPKQHGLPTPSTSLYAQDLVAQNKFDHPNAWPSNQAFTEPAFESNENVAWLGNLLANQEHESAGPSPDMARMDPNLFMALQHAISQGQPSTASSSPSRASASAQDTSGATQVPPSLTSPPYSQALISGLSPAWRPAMASSSAVPRESPLPEEQLLHNVKRLNQEAQDNMDQTNQLQNHIQTLVQNLRLEPAQARHLIENTQSTPDTQVGTVPVNQNTGWTPQSLSGTPLSPPTNSTNGSAPSDFDLDSFLNQFVDPMNQQTASFNPATSPMTDEASDGLISRKT